MVYFFSCFLHNIYSDFTTAKGAARCVEMNECTWCGRWLKIVFHDQMSREDGRYEQMVHGFGGVGGSKEERRERVRPEQNLKPDPCPSGCTRVWIGGEFVFLSNFCFGVFGYHQNYLDSQSYICVLFIMELFFLFLCLFSLFLYKTGLPYDATKEQIVEAFADCGNVVSVQISTDKETGESKGFGHVVFTTEGECELAMMTAAENRGVTVNKQLCRIDYATQRRWEKPRDGGDRSSGSGSGNGSGATVMAEKVHAGFRAGEFVDWKKAPTRSRNRGAVESFQGSKMKLDSSSEDDSDSD